MHQLAYINLCWSFLLPVLALGQANLVPNHSFETQTGCPVGISQISLATPWYQPTVGNCDLFDSCGTIGAGVPNNWKGHQVPLHGSAYAGVFAYGANYREYVGVRLIDSLIAGKTYCCGFYVNRADTSLNACNRMGMYISSDSVFSGTTVALPYQPQIDHPPGTFLLDSVGWTLISDVFIAQGGEKFITIGNFRDDLNTLSWPMSNGTIFYYIDSVFVSEMSTVQGLAGNDTTLCIDSVGGAILGKPQQANLLYSWSSGEQTAQAFVAPISTTTYYLTATDTSSNLSCFYSTVDSVVVYVVDCDTLPPPEPPNNYAGLSNIFSPNSDSNNDLFIVRGRNIDNADLVVYARTGELIYSGSGVSPSWDGTYKGKPMNSGVYVYWCMVVFADGEKDVLKGNVTLVR